MRIKRLRLRNWLCYGGDHELALEAKAYGVVARLASDPERSNFLGKSSLLEAIDFALYGRLNADRHSTADGWITDGAPDGCVELEFCDGTVASRSRKRGKPGAFTYAGAKGDEAQLKLVTATGVDAEEALILSYFQQRRMARLVLADPSERMRYVGAWLELDPLQRAEEIVSADTAKAAKELEEAAAALRAAEVEDVPDVDLERSRLAVEEWAGLVRDVRADIARNERCRASARLVEEAASLVSEGNALRELVDDAALERAKKEAAVSAGKLTTVMGEVQRTSREFAEKSKLAQGQFDGRCPVAGIDCPARAEINARREQNAELLRKSGVALEAAHRVGEEHAKEHRALEARHQELVRNALKLEQLRARYAALKPELEAAQQFGDAVDPASLQLDLDKMIAGHAEAVAVHRGLEAARTKASLMKGAREELQAKRVKLVERLATCREAGQIVGKGGAQRRVAESALAGIESGANAMLSACGIGLQVGVQWCREGQGLAKACDACGSPFPASARAKACERCGAARGPLLVNKMNIVLSDQSGAAEDLAGAAIQLSASAWLRAKRHVAWSVAMLDEPVAQLDAAHRRAFSGHLARILAGMAGFDQALVVAHHSSVLEALPGRIEVTSEGGRSTPRVVA